MKSTDQRLLEEAYRKVKAEPIPKEEKERIDKLIARKDVEDNPSFIGYRGVTLDELEYMERTGKVLPSDVSLVEDNEVLEQVVGPSYREMSDKQRIGWINNTLPWKYNKNDRSVNLTKDLQNAKGYGEAVVAVGCAGPYVDLGKGYVLAKSANDCKILKIFK
jgi:hypothetical protein